MRINALVLGMIGSLLFLGGNIAAAQQPVPIENGDFSAGVDAQGVPVGWSKYAGSSSARLLFNAEEKAVILDDQDPDAEIGFTQAFAAQPNLGYEVRVQVRAFADRSTAGAYLQLRFLPSNKYFQVGLNTEATQDYVEIAVRGLSPEDTTRAQIYLYTHRDPMPKVSVRNVRVISGIEPPPSPPPPPPSPVPPPQYTKLKDMHLTIPLVQEGQAVIHIVAPARYAQAARLLQQGIFAVTGVRVPIISDTDPKAAIPLKGHLIVLGNRSTSRTSNALYDHYYSLMDLKYPGPGGYAIRTLHNPYGNGYSAILVGGSDDEGVLAAATVLRKLLEQRRRSPNLSVGWIMETKLGKGLSVPTDLRQVATWEDSKGYGSVGYFGWNSISKRMALYYMTGDPFHAREAIRLSFPDAQALKEIDAIDEERIENKKDPLAGPYHYNAMMLILFWDLIEESPVFTDEERLKVTNAFARRLAHPQDRGTYDLNTIPPHVGSRHGQWSALSLYTLARYFNKYYPSPVWAHAEQAGLLHFRSLHEHEWIAGEADNLFWYNTGIAPILTYMILTGDRKPLENGVLAKLLRGQEVLISGRVPDWALNYAALDFLHKAAYLTGEGRWLTYRERTGLDTNIFRLGQSFWPDENIKPELPWDLVGVWTVNQMPKPMWETRGTSFKLSESFLNASYRSAPDASGDFILLDGMNGASRNPYHTFAILEYRLKGQTLLQGYLNQVLTSADGMWEPRVPMDGALRYRDVLGPVALAIGEVPHMPYCSWRRRIMHYTGRYSLIADSFAFRTDSDNMKIETLWQGLSGAWNVPEQAIRVAAVSPLSEAPGWKRFRALQARCRTHPPTPDKIALLESLDTVLLRGRQPGEWLEMPFTVPQTLQGELYADMLSYTDRGRARFYLDGQPIGPEFDNWAEGIAETRVPLGPVKLPPGEHVLRVEVVGPHPGVELMNIGLRGVSFKLAGAAEPSATPSYFELRASQAQETSLRGGALTMAWEGPVRKGEQRHIFYLIGQGSAGQPGLACLQIAPNAAILRVPALALVSTGSFQHNQAEMAVLAEDHLYGHQLTEAGLAEPLVQANQPVDIFWDFAAEKLQIVTTQQTKLQLRLSAEAKPRWKDRALTPEEIILPAGRHELTGARPAGNMNTALTALMEEGQKLRATQLAEISRPAVASAPPWAPQMQASVEAKVADIQIIRSRQGPLIAVAAEKTIYLFTPQGELVRRFETDGKIRHIFWWDKPKLLLAGCVDEKLIAFDEQGQRQWIFISEMDPAVYEAAKQYWFKSAPGHEGVHGLFAGPFLNGKEQCFVGGACTLEIVDEKGQLVKRMPLFWGPGSVFQLMPRPDGTIELLVAREPTDGHYLYAVSNKDLKVRTGFADVPPGHTYVGGWANMSRDHIFHVDLDGDGQKEVVSEINGAWNRITIWNEDGKALYNAQFGPGNPIPARNMRDVDLLDWNGDGKIEIITATAAGLLVALDCRCQKVWAKRLASPATVLKTITTQGAPAIVVGCENGDVLLIDNKGEIAARGRIEGVPNKIISLEAEGQALVVLTSDKGVLAGFAY